MATYKGTHITDFDSQPFESVNARLHGGVKKGVVDSFELADTADGDFAIVARLPIDAILSSSKLASDDLGTAGTISIGFYRKDSDGTYVAVDADALASNIDVNTAAVALTEYRYSAKGIETAKQAVWELAGLSARPSYGELYLGLTTETGTTAAGTVLVDLEYTE